MVNRQDDGEDAEDAGPLAEVHFWSSRTIDLSGIHEQLEREGVKKIVEVLEIAKSSYLAPFLKLSQLIEEGRTEAVDNLQFLENLNEPCGTLAEATPAEIPTILPTILNIVRLIWRHSRFYNSGERLAGLLRKVSNEIINRCRASISIGEILEGDVQVRHRSPRLPTPPPHTSPPTAGHVTATCSPPRACGLCVQLSMEALSQSIAAGDAWRMIYDRTEEAVMRASADGKTGWALDRSSIFAQIDAFVQRCRDLQEVCEGQTQFARRAAGGTNAELPVFGGAKGGEVSSQLLAIQSNFEKHVATLKSLNYDILDVKATRWYDSPPSHPPSAPPHPPRLDLLRMALTCSAPPAPP